MMDALGNEEPAETAPEAGRRLWEAGRSEDLPERGRLVVDAGETSVGIFRIDGALYAYENRCPHAGGPICQGLMVPRVVELLDERRAIRGSAFDESDMHVACPWHGYEFSIKTGRHAGLSSIVLRPVDVREADGIIHVLV